MCDAIAGARAASWGIDSCAEVDQSEPTRTGGALPPELAAGAYPSESSASSPAPAAPVPSSASSPPAARSSSATQRNAAQRGATQRNPAERSGLTKNPLKLRYHRTLTANAAAALRNANAKAIRGTVARLEVPHQVHHLCHDICDDTDAAAGALDWVRKTHSAAVACELESAALFRERPTIPRVVGVQHDDWSCPRARRKLAFLVFLLMSPHLLERRHVTGSASDEPLLVTAGVPQSLLRIMFRSSQRDAYCVRTIQRDLAEIEACTDLLLRWRTPAAHAEPWECEGEHGTVNRYCLRAKMVREQWRRCVDAAESVVKGATLRLAEWMVWRPSAPRGAPVYSARGGRICAPL